MKIRESSVYKKWISNLRDERARYRVNARIERLKQGNPGDVKPAGEGVSEMRIDYGPGYRVYFTQKGLEIIILLCGGDKSTQAADIEAAKKIAKEI
jgi:putative addiction module killer protein